MAITNGVRTYMSPREVPPYQSLMDALVRHYGNMTKACDAIGLSDHSYRRLMRDDEISVANARKVMAGYKAMKTESVAA